MFAVVDDAVGVAYHLVIGLTSALRPLTGGFSAAVAIVVFTAAVRLALLPLSRRQARAAVLRRRLEPEARKIRERHRTDPVRVHEELTSLYRAEGTSMWAGVGPSLLQLPVFTVVYRMFLSPSIGGHANLLLAQSLFGTPLGARWLTAGALGPHGLVFLGILIVLAAVAWWTSHTMPRYQPVPPGTLGRIMRIAPFGTLPVAACVPLAAAVYVMTTTLWTAGERAILWRAPITT